MQALHDVVKAGYVRYIGMSSCWAYQCMFRFLRSNKAPRSFLSGPKVSAMQSATPFHGVRDSDISHASPIFDRLRNHPQPHSVHFHAKPLQLALSRGGARDVPDSQGMYHVRLSRSPSFLTEQLSAIQRWRDPVVPTGPRPAYSSPCS